MRAWCEYQDCFFRYMFIYYQSHMSYFLTNHKKSVSTFPLHRLSWQLRLFDQIQHALLLGASDGQLFHQYQQNKQLAPPQIIDCNNGHNICLKVMAWDIQQYMAGLNLSNIS